MSRFWFSGVHEWPPGFNTVHIQQALSVWFMVSRTEYRCTTYSVRPLASVGSVSVPSAFTDSTWWSALTWMSARLSKNAKAVTGYMPLTIAKNKT